MTTIRLMAGFGLALACGMVPCSTIEAQSGSEVVRGKVTAEGKPVAGATITVTGAGSKLERTARTDKSGMYSALFPESQGEYSVLVQAEGYVTQRILARSAPAGGFIVANVTLRREARVLETMEVSAKRTRGRPGGMPPKAAVGRNARDLKTDGAIFSGDPSNLATLAGQTPGVVLLENADGSAGGFSVLGASPNQNNVLVDGLSFDGMRLPSTMVNQASLTATTFDPARGQFSGGQLALTTLDGTNILTGYVGARLSGPALSWREPSALYPVASQQQYYGRVSGPVIRNKVLLMTGFDISRKTQPTPSLAHPTQRMLEQFGLIPDTIRVAMSVLDSLGIPVMPPRHARQFTNTVATGAFRLTTAPRSTVLSSFMLVVAQEQQDGSTGLFTAFPTSASARRVRHIDARFALSGYAKNLLHDFRAGISQRRSETLPYYVLPQGTVRTASQFNDGRTGLMDLQFAGTATAASNTSNRQWQAAHSISWLSLDAQHRVRLTALWQMDRTSTATGTSLGVFRFQSLEDLRAGSPISYTRMLAPNARTVNLAKWAISLGDEWMPHSLLQLEYGLRLDGARTGTLPGYNPLVDSLFGLRTDRVPRTIGLSPRVGFVIGHGDILQADGNRLTRQALRFVGREGLQGAIIPLAFHGGVGAFRGVPDAAKIASFAQSTGLPNTARLLSCVGDATPVPNWTAFLNDPDSAPIQCLDGTAPAEFSANRPNVFLFTPDYKPSVAWRLSLNLDGIQAYNWLGGIWFDHSIERNRESQIDYNFRRSAAFTVSNEGNRPVFVSSAAIVPETGLLAPGASRIHDAFGQVNATISDLSSHASQVVIWLERNPRFWKHIPLTFDYTWLRSRMQQRGVQAPTAGDPLVAVWGAGNTPTHMINIGSGYRSKWVNIDIRLSFQSGMPYTPIVAGDVNGDGMYNDLAFVFDPAQSDDPVLANQMQQLLTSATTQSRRCLQQQANRIAGLNSCRTGWQMVPVMTINIANPHRDVELHDRLRFNFATTNIMSALTRALGLANSALGRAASRPRVDPYLLYVEGFDPGTRTFRYRVNQQFGDERRNTLPASRQPFQVWLGANIIIGGPPMDQLAKQLGVWPAPGVARPTDSSAMSALRKLVNNPLIPILLLRDSLGLTPEQFAFIERAAQRLNVERDDAFQPLADLIVRRRGRVGSYTLNEQIKAAKNRLAVHTYAAVRALPQQLTAEQISRLPAGIRQTLRPGVAPDVINW